MNLGISPCQHCGTPFWPAADEVLCPACARLAQEVPEAIMVEGLSGEQVPPISVQRAAPRRFAPLSSLPPQDRLPPRREAKPSKPLPSGALLPRHPSPSAPPAILPRQIPGVPDVKRPVKEKQIGFNCPSCMVVLVIKQPENYDGRPAPCPSCGTNILPPRIAPVSPFSIVAGPSGKLPTAAPAPLPMPERAPRHPTRLQPPQRELSPPPSVPLPMPRVLPPPDQAPKGFRPLSEKSLAAAALL